jgi:hypothetical protein
MAIDQLNFNWVKDKEYEVIVMLFVSALMSYAESMGMVEIKKITDEDEFPSKRVLHEYLRNMNFEADSTIFELFATVFKLKINFYSITANKTFIHDRSFGENVKSDIPPLELLIKNPKNGVYILYTKLWMERSYQKYDDT